MANVLIVHGTDSTENNVLGVIAKGGVVGTGTSNEVDIVLTNRVRGTVTTTDATPTAVITFALSATPGVYTFDVNIAGLDVTDTLGVGYSIFGTIRSTGAAAILVGTPDKIINEENATVTPANTTLTVSGNNAIIQVTGVAGKTFRWLASGNYVFVS